MKKSSAWIMLVPGLVILLVCLAIPLLRVLAPRDVYKRQV